MFRSDSVFAKERKSARNPIKGLSSVCLSSRFEVYVLMSQSQSPSLMIFILICCVIDLVLPSQPLLLLFLSLRAKYEAGNPPGRRLTYVFMYCIFCAQRTHALKPRDALSKIPLTKSSNIRDSIYPLARKF